MDFTMEYGTILLVDGVFMDASHMTPGQFMNVLYQAESYVRSTMQAFHSRRGAWPAIALIRIAQSSREAFGFFYEAMDLWQLRYALRPQFEAYWLAIEEAGFRPNARDASAPMYAKGICLCAQLENGSV